ncbi:MAG: small multi-drug export protein [Candidatus Uhrbacteria bacterium]
MLFSPEILTLFSAALPLTELRGSIPLAVSVFHLAPWTAFFYSIIGNALPVPIIFFLLPKILIWLEKRIPWLHKYLVVWLEKKRAKFQNSYDKYGALALAIFVAIPLPMTGAWTGAALATILKIKPKYSFSAVILGMVVAGVIVTLIVSGVLGFLAWMV